MIGGLQMVELLLHKASANFKSSFRREGVLYEIEILASRLLPQRPKEKKVKEEGKEDVIPSSGTPLPLVPTPILAVLSSGSSSSRRGQSVEPEDAAKANLAGIADLFASPDTSISSFELLQSEVVDALLEFATGKEYSRESFGRLFISWLTG
jgi:E3 ubiquitin-protein ligase TRIP12